MESGESPFGSTIEVSSASHSTDGAESTSASSLPAVSSKSSSSLSPLSEDELRKFMSL